MTSIITMIQSWNWPTRIMALIVFLLPWQTKLIIDHVMLGDFATSFPDVSLYAVECLVLAVFFIMVSSRRLASTLSVDRQYRLPCLLALLVFAVSALSLAWSVSLLSSAAMLLHLGSALLLFVLLIDEDVEPRPIIMAFALGLIIPIILGIVQVFSGGSPASTIFGLAARDASWAGDVITMIDGERVLRAYGSFPHPNVFGGYLAVALASMIMFFNRRGGVQGPRLWVLATVLLIGLITTLSRSAILGLALGLGLAFLVAQIKNTKIARLAVIPLAVLVIGGALVSTIIVPGIVASVRGGGEFEDRSVAERVEQYGDYPAVAFDNWLIGSGIGTYVTDAYETKTCGDWDCQPIHNVPLLILSEIGLLGLILVLAWSSSIDRLNFARFPNRDALAAFAMGNVVLVVLFFDHYIWSSWPGLALIAIVMAVTLRLGEPELAKTLGKD